jgi:hypothetical protein
MIFSKITGFAPPALQRRRLKKIDAANAPAATRARA